MFKRIIWLFIFIVGGLNGYPQYSFRIGGGCTYNFYSKNISNLSFTEKDPDWGYEVFLLSEKNITDKINLVTGISAIEKNYFIRRTGIYTGIKSRYINTYLQLPLYVTKEILRTEKACFLFDAGLYISYWNWARIKGTIPNIYNSISNAGNSSLNLELTSYSEKYSFDQTIDRRSEIGGIIGVSFKEKIKKRMGVVTTIHFQPSFTSQKKQNLYENGAYNNTIILNVGLYYNTNKK